MESNPQLAIVFIHFGGATSPLPTLRCLPASWFHMMLRPGPCRALAMVAMETTHKDKVEEGGRERCLHTRWRARGSVWRRCPVIGCRHPLIPPTHPSVSSSLVQNSWLLLLLLARSHPLRVSLSHCQWCCAPCVDLLPNQRTQGEEKTAAVEAVCGHREETLETGIFSEAPEWLRLSTRTERKEDARGDANNDKGGRFQEGCSC